MIMPAVSHVTEITNLSLDLLQLLKKTGATVTIELNLDTGLSFECDRGAFGVMPDMPWDLAKGYIHGSLEEFLDDEPF